MLMAYFHQGVGTYLQKDAFLLSADRPFDSVVWRCPPPQKISSTNSRCFPSKHENFEERQPGLRGLSLQVWHFSFFEIT